MGSPIRRKHKGRVFPEKELGDKPVTSRSSNENEYKRQSIPRNRNKKPPLKREARGTRFQVAHRISESLLDYVGTMRMKKSAFSRGGNPRVAREFSWSRHKRKSTLLHKGTNVVTKTLKDYDRAQKGGSSLFTQTKHFAKTQDVGLVPGGGSRVSGWRGLSKYRRTSENLP